MLVAAATVQRKLCARCAGGVSPSHGLPGSSTNHESLGFICFSVVLHFLDQIDTGCWLLLWFGECLSLGASASSALFLLVVSSNLMPGGDPSPRPFPYKGSSPCMALDGETWSLDVLFKGVTIRFKRKVVVSGNFWLARLPSPLVPILLA